jgi:hypothetical protein
LPARLQIEHIDREWIAASSHVFQRNDDLGIAVAEGVEDLPVVVFELRFNDRLEPFEVSVDDQILVLEH